MITHDYNDAICIWNEGGTKAFHCGYSGTKRKLEESYFFFSQLSCLLVALIHSLPVGDNGEWCVMGEIFIKVSQWQPNGGLEFQS